MAVTGADFRAPEDGRYYNFPGHTFGGISHANTAQEEGAQRWVRGSREET